MGIWKELKGIWDRETRDDMNYNFGLFARDIANSLLTSKTAEDKSKSAESIAQNAKNTAERAETVAESTQKQLDDITIAGDSSVEAAQARTNSETGENFANLRNRLDTENKRVTQQLAQIKQAIYYVEEFGAKGNYNPDTDTGADDSQAFQDAVNYIYSQGGGLIGLSLYKKYKITRRIVWKSGVGVKGAGVDLSSIYGVGDLGAIFWQPGRTVEGNVDDYHPSNPMRNMDFTGFSMNGSKMTTYGKGILLFFLKNVKFEDIKLIDTPATALGCDFLDDVEIRRVHVIRGGRLFDLDNPNRNLGGSGIGIGTGAWGVERVVVSDCRTENCGNHGIFFERQGYNRPDLVANLFSRGIIVENCYSSGNGTSGIGDHGTDGMLIKDCICENNRSGIEVTRRSRNGRIINCEIAYNTNHGVDLTYLTLNGYYIDDRTRIHHNGFNGINIGNAITADPLPNLKIEAEIFNNGRNAIFVNRELINPMFINGKWYNNGQNLLGNFNQSGLTIRQHIRNPLIKNNTAFDNQDVKTQAYGINTDSSFEWTDGLIRDNNLRGNNVGSMRFVSLVVGQPHIHHNDGFNPIGITPIQLGGYTLNYTSGYTKETLYVFGEAANMTITLNGSILIIGANSAIIELEPYDNVVITHSGLTSAKVYKH